jgi:hypothetical protein
VEPPIGIEPMTYSLRGKIRPTATTLETLAYLGVSVRCRLPGSADVRSDCHAVRHAGDDAQPVSACRPGSDRRVILTCDFSPKRLLSWAFMFQHLPTVSRIFGVLAEQSRNCHHALTGRALARWPAWARSSVSWL